MSMHSPHGAGPRRARIAALAALGLATFFFTACGGGSSMPQPASTQRHADASPAEFDKLQQEQYGTIVENAFQSPQVAPLSTFSADVNTASYSNIRRFLNEGKLPPRDAVFLAEMINYFPYRYPQPDRAGPASLSLDLAACPWKPEHKLARIGVQARSIPESEIPPRNLVFLIDVSGSMDGPTRLPLVKQSLGFLIDRLRPVDRVAIVTYAQGTSVRLQPTTGDRREAIRDAVRSLHAGGGTNGEGGIQLAYELARRGFLDAGVNRVILCTDGDFNVGATSESELVQLIERERASRVFLSVLGYGMGNLKNQTLEQLANNGNGHYAYIDSEAEARKVFVEQGAALAVVAKDVKFQVEFNPSKVAAYRLLGYENRILKAEDFKNDAKDAGDIGAGLQVTALYEIVPFGVKIDLPGVDPLKYQTVPKASGGTDEWLTAKMRYKRPDADASKELELAMPGFPGTADPGADFRFAAAVAEFGMCLRNSPHKGNASLAGALSRAEKCLGYDPGGHRAEFLQLVKKAMALNADRE
jgi:Ca-activated chloride channel family protein